MDPLHAFRREAEAALDAALARLGVDAARPPLETPPDPSMGDLGMPCFPLAKALRKAPAAIAHDIAAAVDADGSGWIQDARAAGPYVNVHMDRQRLAREIFTVGVPEPDPKPGPVLLEHTSANPNGPLHVGRARNPILGDTLARLLRAAGHDVHTQYYMDNLGRQVALLYYGKTHIDPTGLEPPRLDKVDHDLVRYYQAANARMREDEAVAAEVAELVARLEAADEDLLPRVRAVYEACFSGMQESLARLGVTYDSIKDESDLVRAGEVDRVVRELRESPRWGQEDDGANYLDLGAELEGSKSTKFYFTRKDGSSVYATRDIAYHRWKAEQVGAEGRLVDVLGEDHRLQALQVAVALEELGHPRPDVVFYAFVSLPDGKMSTRANRVVFVDDLIEEAVARAQAAVEERRGDELDAGRLRAIAEHVGIAAIRFNIARVQPEKPIRFRWEEALDFEGGAPYLLYAHARAASLLRKAGEEGIQARFDPDAVGTGEVRLAGALARFVPTLEDAAAAYAPHRLCGYLIGLAAAFNEYYRDHPVIAAEDEAVRSSRLAVVTVAKDVMRRGLEALGLPVLDAM